MIRKTLTFVSLLGLMVSSGLWVISSKQPLQLNFGSKQAGWAIVIGDGKVQILRLQRVRFGIARLPGEVVKDWADTWWIHSSVHLLVVAIVSAGILACCVVPFGRHHERKRLGLCVNCGYNLEGLTDPRCPECNTRFEKP